jgi:hypothetical protein
LTLRYLSISFLGPRSTKIGHGAPTIRNIKSSVLTLTLSTRFSILRRIAHSKRS